MTRMAFERVTLDHRIMGGVPCIRGTRIPVATVVGLLADGLSIDEIIADYPQLDADDLHEALRYAAATLRERELPLKASA